MANDPWKWMERANKALVGLRRPPPLPKGGLPAFDPSEFREVFFEFSKTGLFPEFDGRRDGDHLDLLFFVRVLRQIVAVNWQRLAKIGTAYDFLNEMEALHREALIHQSAFTFSVDEFRYLHECGMLPQEAFAFALSRQASFLVSASRGLAGKAADFIDRIEPKRRGRKSKIPFDVNDFEPSSVETFNQKDFIAFAAVCTAQLDGIPIRTAIKSVIGHLAEFGEIKQDFESLERAIARHLGKP
jgi:hypothetical protein